MNTVYFVTETEFDINAVTTMGVSAKESDNAIGKFGTGLKYAIAVLLREKQEIKIYTYNFMYDFSTKPLEIRGKTFNIVHMETYFRHHETFEVELLHEEKLGFTTEYGLNWSLWQAYRELACNTIDERGEVFGTVAGLEPNVRDVVIEVKGTAFFEQGYEVRDTIILPDSLSYETPVFESSEVTAYEGATTYLYHKGIRVYEHSEPFMYTYNFRGNISLTEDRTIAYMYEPLEALATAVIQSENEQAILQFLKPPKHATHHERTLDLDKIWETPSATCLALIKEHKHDEALNSTAKSLGKRHKVIIPYIPYVPSIEESKRFLNAYNFWTRKNIRPEGLSFRFVVEPYTNPEVDRSVYYISAELLKQDNIKLLECAILDGIVQYVLNTSSTSSDYKKGLLMFATNMAKRKRTKGELFNAS